MTSNNLATLLMTALSALTLGACSTGEAQIDLADAADEVAPLPVVVAAPARADIFATYHTTTNLRTDTEAPVVARVGGEVVEVLVEEGDRVQAGQVLARLDGDRLRLQMLQAQANLEQAQKEYERFVRLKDKGLVSASMAEGLRYDMDSLAANFELRRLDYEYTAIRAPISGVVSARYIKLGQNVAINERAFHVTDPRELIAYLRIPQVELPKFSAGHRAQLRVDAMPGASFDATVVRISPTIDMANGTFRATVSIDNRDGLLAPGMFGRFDIAYEKHADALVIPADALLEEDSETVVYVIENDAAVRRVIRTGIRTGNQVEVLDGLDASESIVVTGQGGLRDGSRVFASIDTARPATG